MAQSPPALFSPLRMAKSLHRGATSPIYTAKRMYRVLTPNSLGDAKLGPAGIMEGVYDSTATEFQKVKGSVLVSLDFSGLEKEYSQHLARPRSFFVDSDRLRE